MIKYIKTSPTAKDLSRGSEGAAGFDICADDNAIIEHGERSVIETNIGLEFSDSIYCRVSPRSGLAVKSGVDVLSGVIDSDYRGTVKVVLINHGYSPVYIARGDRIAQLIFSPVLSCVEEWKGTVSETDRGANGFGSTGI